MVAGKADQLFLVYDLVGVSQIFLADAQHLAAHAHAASNVKVNGVGRAGFRGGGHEGLHGIGWSARGEPERFLAAQEGQERSSRPCSSRARHDATLGRVTTCYEPHSQQIIAQTVSA
jgi:hypothetical protein